MSSLSYMADQLHGKIQSSAWPDDIGACFPLGILPYGNIMNGVNIIYNTPVTEYICRIKIILHLGKRLVTG